MRFAISALVLVAATLPIAATAQQRTGYTQIASGDWATAEQTLTAERRVFPRKPELMLNLAAVYQRTNRATEARALYTEVMARPNVLMDVSAERTAWSHDLARNGLRRIGGVQMSAR